MNGNDNTVSLVNIATCNGHRSTGCSQVPMTANVGAFPVAAAVDTANHTVYVTNAGTNTVSMFDDVTCNATTTVGCSHVPVVTVGNAPDFAAVDSSTRTVYVVNAFDNTVSVIDAQTCNAITTTGCGHVSTVTVGNVPTGLAVDAANHTVYVANGLGLSTPGSISMINAATCNGTVTSGCGQLPRTTTAGVGAAWVTVNPSTHTAYVAGESASGRDTSLGFVDVIDDDTCNATVSSGCRTTPIAVTVGSGPVGVVADPESDYVYVANQEDSTVSVINGAVCRGNITKGCSKPPLTMAVGFDPTTLDVDPTTDTILVPDYNENAISVLNGAACTLTRRSGCRTDAPTSVIGNGPAGSAADRVTDTVYVSNRSDDDLSVINGAACDASAASGCGTNWPTVRTGPWPQAVAVNSVTDTIYTADSGMNFSGGHTVSVINGATCNATNHSGCGQHAATVDVGNFPYALAINEITDTVYVVNLADNTVSVINGATCNGTHHSGCGTAPPTIAVGGGPDGVAVDQLTDTVYVANGNDNDVSVINGATCDGNHHGGCTQVAPTVPTAGSGDELSVDEATDTVYVANYPNSISVIDGATCNATTHAGCAQIAPTMVTGTSPFSSAIDQATDTLFVDSTIDSDASAYDGATCNAIVTTGCDQEPVIIPTGGYPGQLAVDEATHTIYVPDNVDGEVSFFGFAHGVAFP